MSTALVALAIAANANYARAGWSDSATSDSATSSADAKNPPPDLAGTWSGNIKDEGDGSGTLTLQVTQNKSKIGGLFEIETNSQGSFGGDIASGSVNGNKGTVKFKFEVAKDCAPKVKATLSNGNTTMTGSYFQNTKHCKANGTFSVSLEP